MKKTKDNINILFAGRYSDAGILSGPEVTAKSVFDEHCVHNSSVFIQYFFDGRRYSIYKKLFGKESVELNNSKILTLGLFRIIPELQKSRPGIIHLITYERFAIIFYIYKLLFSVKIIYNSHGVVQHENSELKNVPAYYKFKDKFCEKIYLKYSDKVIYPSIDTMNIAEKYYHINENRVVILPNGVSEIFFTGKEKSEFTNRIKAVMHFKNSLNNSGIKLLEKLLRGIKVLTDIYMMTNENIDLSNTDSINFYFHKMIPAKDMPGFYEDKDVFLSLNKYDTFSISTAEAMASGLIPIVTSQTGISRYIQNGINGYVFDYIDIAGLKGILNTLAATAPQKQIELSREAVKTAEELRWGIVYKMYFELYREITE